MNSSARSGPSDTRGLARFPKRAHPAGFVRGRPQLQIRANYTPEAAHVACLGRSALSVTTNSLYVQLLGFERPDISTVRYAESERFCSFALQVFSVTMHDTLFFYFYIIPVLSARLNSPRSSSQGTSATRHDVSSFERTPITLASVASCAEQALYTEPVAIQNAT